MRARDGATHHLRDPGVTHLRFEARRTETGLLHRRGGFFHRGSETRDFGEMGVGAFDAQHPKGLHGRRARGKSVGRETGFHRRQRGLHRLGQRETTRGRGERGRRQQRLLERLDAFAAFGHRGHDRHTQLVNELRHVDLNTFRLGDVELIEGNDHRHAQFEHLSRQEEIALEVHGVDDHEHDLWCPAVRIAALEHVERDLLIGRAGRQRVTAWQIEDDDATSVRALERAFDTIDGDAGEVADTLPESGQRIEERRLAGIRVADDGNPQLRRGWQAER